jgi:hypothetical protein
VSNQVVNFWDLPLAQSQCLRPPAWWLHKVIPRAVPIPAQASVPERRPAKSELTGLSALLTPEDCVVLLVDHQPFQFANLHSHEPAMIVNNVIGLAKFAKAFNVPVILTTVLEARGGKIINGWSSVITRFETKNCRPVRSACPA